VGEVLQGMLHPDDSRFSGCLRERVVAALELATVFISI